MYYLKAFKLKKNISNKKIIKILSIISIFIFLFAILLYSNNNKVFNIINNKDIISYLLIGSISQVINLHISNISKNLILPTLSILINKDLTKSFKINNININVNDIITNLIESLLNLLFIFIIFRN